MLENLFNVDWDRLFTPTTPLIEIFVRGTLMYFGVFLLLRFVLKRESGDLNRSDLLVLLLVAEAAQNGLADNYHSVVDGLFLVATILLWSYALDWLSFHIPWMERLVQPRPIQIFKEGRLFRKNMRRELLTYDELLNEVRKAGHTDLAEIKEIFMEGDGSISVIPHR